MMRCWRMLLTLGLLGALLACAPGPSREPAPGEVARPAPPPVKVERLDFSTLTGAEILEGPPRQIVYRPEQIYPRGAVLPSSGGLAHLEVLADWLKAGGGLPLGGRGRRRGGAGPGRAAAGAAAAFFPAHGPRTGALAVAGGP